MRRPAALVVATALLLAAVGGARPAVADEQVCKLDPVSGQLRCTLIATPAPPRTVKLSDELPLVWRRVPFTVSELIARDIGCIRDEDGVRVVGAGYAVALNNEVTGEQLYLTFVCTWPGDPPPQPPPAPPSMGEFRDSNAQALTLDPLASPAASIGGLTGLDSWFWCEDPGPISTGVSLRGWTASGEVEVVAVGWEVGREIALNSTTCGSEEAPSATWTPESIGDYPITLTAVWAGSWDLSWNGIPMGSFPLGPISLSAPSQPYPVDEYRGELTG